MTDHCDYCLDDLPPRFYLRAIAMDREADAPVVQAWCGLCIPGDKQDPEARERLRSAIERRAS